MATYTSKLNLKKPLGTEHVSRQDMNDNYDKIDAAVVTNTNAEISNSLLIGNRLTGSSIGANSIAHGGNVEASGINSYAGGYMARATGAWSHAEGGGVAGGVASHAEGTSSAMETDSHAEGALCVAGGEFSHAEGYTTNAMCRSQHTGGEFNVIDTDGDAATHGKYVEIIGNGTANNSRSNARSLDWDGNEYLAGDLYVGCNADSTGGKKISDAFTGATSSAAGSVGLVPAPSAGDHTKVLTGAGTWESVAGASDMTGATASTPGVHGLVPAPAAGDQTKFLSGAGTWEPVGGASDMTGATASTAGVHGLVPAPAAGDQNKVLKGDGTWDDPEDARIGDLTNLQTTDKSSVVGAINELFGGIMMIRDVPVSSQSYTKGGYKSVSVDLRYAGYVPLAVIGLHGDTTSILSLGDTDISNTGNSSIVIWNNFTGDRTSAVTLKVLYARA